MSGRQWDHCIAYLGYAGGLGILVSLVAWIITRRQSLLVELCLLGGLALLALGALLRPAALGGALLGRRMRPGGELLIAGVAGLILLLLVNLAAQRYHVRLDWTAGQRYSVSEQTVRILKELQGPIKVTGFFVAADAIQAAQQAALTGLLDEYRFHSDKISYEFVDPALKPALAKQYGISGYGALALEMGQRRTETFALDEQGLTAAILKVSRSQGPALYFIAGHGERDPNASAEAGYAGIKRELERDNYRVEKLDLAGTAGVVPADAAALLIISPQAEFTPAERGAIMGYARAGGRVLLTCDPGDDAVDSAWLAEWGLRVRDDLVIDPTNAFIGDIAAPTATSYPWHTITKGLNGAPTFFPFVRSLEALSPAPANMQVAPLVMSGAESWGETHYAARQQVKLDAEEDTAGPLMLAAAVQETTRQGRLVVFGGSFFVANGILSSVRGEFGNGQLFLNAVNWLTEDTELFAIRSRQPQERRVTLSRAQANLVLYSSALLLPLATLAVGFAAWWANR